MFKVTIWNEEVERTYNVLTNDRKEAVARAIRAEVEERRVPRYRIHVTETHKV